MGLLRVTVAGSLSLAPFLALAEIWRLFLDSNSCRLWLRGGPSLVSFSFSPLACLDLGSSSSCCWLSTFKSLEKSCVCQQMISPSTFEVTALVPLLRANISTVSFLLWSLSDLSFGEGCSPEHAFSLGQFKCAVGSFPGFQTSMHIVVSLSSEGESKGWDLKQSGSIEGALVTLLAGFLPSTLLLAFANAWLLLLSSDVNVLSLV